MGGVCFSFVYPPSVKLLSTWFPIEHRGYAVGVLFNFFSFGVAFPHLLIFVDLPWEAAVAGTSLAAFVSGVLILTCARVGPFEFPASSFDVTKCKDVLREPSVALPILAYCGHQWEAVCVWAWIGMFLEKIWHLPLSTVPLLSFSIIALGG